MADSHQRRSWRAWARHASMLAALMLYAGALVVSIKPRNFAHLERVHWGNWSDQGAYLRSARAFASLSLDAGDHWYPLLYPLLGAPFTLLSSHIPFVLVDLVCFGCAFAGFRRVATLFSVGRWTALVIFVATTILYPRIGKTWAEPWTTNLSSALIWLSLALALPLLIDRSPGATLSPRRSLCLGALLALIPCTRPADLVVSAVIALFVAGSLLVNRREWRSLMIVTAAGAVVALAYGALHLAVYGARPSDYMILSGAYGLALASVGWKAYLILVEPIPWFPDGQGLLAVCPWLPLGAAGLIVWACRRSPTRRAAVCLLLGATIYLVMMLAYVDLLPSGLWRYNNVHYFKWLLPLLGLFTFLFVRGLRALPLPLLGVATALCAAASLRLSPEPADDGPARELIFDRPAASFDTIYAARSAIDDARGWRRNFFEYHQIAAGSHVVAIAIRRDFAGQEHWFGAAPAPQTPWPKVVPGTQVEAVLPGPWPRRPIGRYRVGIGFGRPCWLPPYPCRRGSL